MAFDKLLLVTRKTRLEELVARFNTHGQAKFYIERAGGDFADYEREHDVYVRARDRLRAELTFGLARQELDRTLVPTYMFAERELVVTLGQDGLVANVAKYAGNRPIVGVNPDPSRFDGVLLPFTPAGAAGAVRQVLEGRAATRAVTLAEIALSDGQRLLAFNDLFIGTRTHGSARYRITALGSTEPQSSSGVLVCTGAGSTGWMSSVFNMAAGVTAFAGGTRGRPVRFAWDDRRLIFVVREPFASLRSSAAIVAGLIEPEQEILLESLMPSGGVVFSDGIESDHLDFNAGTLADVRTAAQQAFLVVQGSRHGAPD